MRPRHRNRDAVRERKGEEIKGRGAADQKKKGRGTSKKEGCNTRTSKEVTHPSTTLTQARLKGGVQHEDFQGGHPS